MKVPKAVKEFLIIFVIILFLSSAMLLFGSPKAGPKSQFFFERPWQLIPAALGQAFWIWVGYRIVKYIYDKLKKE